ncbi:hypothetical protein Tco_0099093 [Tanacetum coccineum]
MTRARALESFQDMVDHSHKWHDGTSNRRTSGGNSVEIVIIINKLDNLGRNMKKLKENIHVIQVGCELCEGMHLDKECPLNKEFKRVEEVKYGKFGRPSTNNGGNEVSYTTELLGVSFVYDYNVLEIKKENEGSSGVLSCQPHPKELNPGSFTLPCTIGSLNMYALEDLGANVNIMPFSMFKSLELTNLKETTMKYTRLGLNFGRNGSRLQLDTKRLEEFLTEGGDGVRINYLRRRLDDQSTASGKSVTASGL